MCERVSENWWRDNDQEFVEFGSFEELESFSDRCSKHMATVEHESHWDLIEIPVKFYSQFKENGGEILESFSKFSYDVRDKGFESICVGKALKLKNLLVEEFLLSHADLEHKLFFASTATDKLLDKNDVLSVDTIDKDVYRNLNVHCTLALRIRLNNRAGFLFFELVVYNFKPAIIMEDNSEPTTHEINLPYDRISKFKCVDKSYVITVIKSKNQDNNEFVFISYVKRAFERVDLAIKYYSLFFIKFPVIFISKRLSNDINSMIILKHFDGLVKIETLDHSGQFLVEEFSLDYFKKGQFEKSVEKAIERVAISFEKDPLLMRKELEIICGSLLDESFAIKSVSLMKYILGSRN